MKEELDRAESFKILQHAADDLRGIPDIENKKDLAVKKWEEATAAVPKKHRETFYEKKYEEARQKYKLFVLKNWYGKYINDELSVSCYWVQKYAEGKKLLEVIIKDPELYKLEQFLALYQ